jgi:ABC-type glycerol-3-phosphate transport system substrate-binding protein
MKKWLVGLAVTIGLAGCGTSPTSAPSVETEVYFYTVTHSEEGWFYGENKKYKDYPGFSFHGYDMKDEVAPEVGETVRATFEKGTHDGLLSVELVGGKGYE